MVSEKAEQGARGKMLVDEYRDISKAAGLANRTLPSIEANLSALNKGLDTGFGKETVAAGASVLAALGVKDAEKFATDTQKFQSNAIGAVLQKQLEQKGPQTESDARRIEQIGAQLGKTKAANEFILGTAKEQLRRDVEQRNFYDRWYKTNKTYDGAEDAWFSGEGGRSLFDRPALKKYAINSNAPTAADQIPTAASRIVVARITA
jgi:predicted RNase H-like nuclease (RuvC/YqgF family)